MDNHSYTVFSRVELLLRKSKFTEVDDLLRTLDLETLDSTGILSVLTMAGHGREHLTEFKSFAARVEPVLIERLGAERAERLLKNRR